MEPETRRKTGKTYTEIKQEINRSIDKDINKVWTWLSNPVTIGYLTYQNLKVNGDQAVSIIKCRKEVYPNSKGLQSVSCLRLDGPGIRLIRLSRPIRTVDRSRQNQIRISKGKV